MSIPSLRLSSKVRRVLLALVLAVASGVMLGSLLKDGDRMKQTLIAESMDRVEHTLPRPEQKLEDAATSPVEHDSTTNPTHSVGFDYSKPLWVPGGVLGPTLHETTVELDDIFHSIFSSSKWPVSGSSPSPAVIVEDICNVGGSHAAAINGTNLVSLIFAATLALSNQSKRRDDDCVMHLMPHQRAICMLAAALDKPSKDNDCRDGDDAATSLSAVPMSQRCAFRQSYCGRLLPCAYWMRGRFSVTLSGELFDHVMASRVWPKLRRNARSFHVHQDVFLHGEVAVARSKAAAAAASTTTKNMATKKDEGGVDVMENLREMAFLKRRFTFQENVTDKMYELFPKRERRLHQRIGYKGVNKGEVLDADDFASLNVSLPTWDVFQGAVVETKVTPPEAPYTALSVDVSRSRAPSSIRHDGIPSPAAEEDDHSFEYLTSMETLAIMYSMCTGRSSLTLRRENNNEPPPPCVLLMHGDSVLREFYDRLIIHIRYGMLHSTPGKDAWKNIPRQFQVSSTEDFVYRVFTTHDEVFRLVDTMDTPSNSSWTLNSYLDDIIAAHHDRSSQKVEKSSTEVGAPYSSLVPFFHIIFAWDHLGHKPRQELYTVPSTVNDNKVQGASSWASRPMRVPLQVHGFNFWGKIVHLNMVTALWKLATANVSVEISGDEATTTRNSSIPSSLSSGNNTTRIPPSQRMLYIMTPPHRQPLGSTFVVPPSPTAVSSTKSPSSYSPLATESDVEAQHPAIHPVSLNHVAGHWPRSRPFIERWRNYSVKNSTVRPDHSVSRSLQWLLWLNDTVADRRRIWRQPASNKNGGGLIETTIPYVKSVAVFDKSKGQFAGFPLSDHTHYGCRCQVVRDAKRFVHAFFPPPIEQLLKRRLTPLGSKGGLCGGSLNVADLSSMLHQALLPSAMLFWDMHNKTISRGGETSGRAFHAKRIPQDPKRPGKFFSIVERTNTDTKLQEEKLMRFAVMPMNPPKAFVYLEWLSDECRGSGDHYFLQLILYDAALKLNVSSSPNTAANDELLR